MLGMPHRGEAEKGVDGGEATIAGPHAHAPAMLEVVEERCDECGVEILERELCWRDLLRVLREAQQHAEGVTIGGDGVRAGVALGAEALDEECLERGSKRCHWRTSPRSPRRSAAAANNSGDADKYQYVDAGLTWPR